MSSRGSPVKATLLPWLNNVSSNKRTIATYMSNVDHQDQVNITKSKKETKIKRKRNRKESSIPKSTKKKIRSDQINNDEQKRLTEYISHSTNFPTEPVQEQDCNFGSTFTVKKKLQKQN